MSFTVPTFNLVVNHWRMSLPYDFTTAVSLPTFMGNLRGFGKVPHPYWNNPSSTGLATDGFSLLCPPLTDIRDPWCVGTPLDMVEVPAGSGRYYQVFSVEDVAKGFPNEYRVATVGKSSLTTVLNWPHWPVPIP